MSTFTPDRLAAHLRERGASTPIQTPSRVLASYEGIHVNFYFDPETGRFQRAASNVGFAENCDLTHYRTLKTAVDALKLPRLVNA